MFRHGKIFWDGLWQAGIALVLAQYGIAEGVLVIDDSDVQRAKRTTRIHRAHLEEDAAAGL